VCDKSQEREAVKVAVRLRSMVLTQNPAGQCLNFKFDFAYPAGIRQEEIDETTAAPIVSAVLEGMNRNRFAYGQTDELRDLLATEKPKALLEIREDPNQGGVCMHKVTKLDDLWRLMDIGKQNHRRAMRSSL
jgi:hypothetical protein